jgi:FMN phosphatase YigB (HAD superfamily)
MHVLMNPILLKNYELLLFDLDDTLFNHTAAFQRSIYDIICRFQILKGLGQSEFLNTFTMHHQLLLASFSSTELNFQEFSIMRLENTLADFNMCVSPEVALE